MKDLFDRMLREMPAESKGLPRINQFLVDKILGTKKKKLSVFAYMVKQARRAGVTLEEEDLQRRYDKLAQDAPTATMSLPVKIDVGLGLKSEYTAAEFAEVQTVLDNRTMAAAAMEQPNVAIDAAIDSVRERNITDAMDQFAHKSGAIVRAATGLLIGGDASSALRGLPAHMRKLINAGSAKVNEAVGNFVTLLTEDDWDKALKYLSGEVVSFSNGRQAYSSGWDCVVPVAVSLRRSIEQSDDFKILSALADELDRGKGLGKKPGQTIAEIPKGKGLAAGPLADLSDPLKQIDAAAKQLLGQQGEDSFIKALMEAVELKPVRGADRLDDPVRAFGLVEALTHFAGATIRDGEMISSNSYERAEVFLNDIKVLFGDQKSRRVALLLAGHGHAHAARSMWAKTGIAVTEEVREAFLHWINGEAIDLRLLPKVEDVVQRYGLNPNFLDSPILETDFYIPLQARKRLSDSLARASDVRTTSLFSTASEQELRGLMGLSLRYVKKKMTRGAYFTKSRYFLMNTFDHFNQMALIVGYHQAAASTGRMVTQNLLAIPGVAQLIELIERTPLLQKGQLEKLRRHLQVAGDRVSTLISQSKYRIEVNPILEAKEGSFRVGSRIYTYRALRDIAVEEGIFASFDTSEFRKAVDLATPSGWDRIAKLVDPLGFQKTTDDVAEAWAERERLGAMVTLIESGMSPRKAARLTIDALYDYAGSMTKMDRWWLVSLIVPFWAFQKNANRQILNGVFTPKVAYRMGVLRRAEDLGPEGLTQVLYEFVAEPCGVDVDHMPVEAQDNYWTLRKQVEEHYGGPHKVPREARLALRMLFAERAMGIVAGDYVELDTLLQEANQITAMGTEAYSIRRPDPSARPQYLRGRSGIAITLPRTEAVLGFMRHINATQGDYPWTEIYLPDSTIHAGMRHISGMAAFYIVSGDLLVKSISDATGIRDEEFGKATGSPVASLRTIAEPERNPITAQALELWLKTPESSRALRVHAQLVPLIESMGFGVAEYSGVDDPIWAEAEEAAGVPPGEAGAVATRYYVSPGFMSSPLERTHWSGEILRWARPIVGFQTAEILRPRTVRMDEPTFTTKTKKPPTR